MMKNYILILMVVLLQLSCSKKDNNENNKETKKEINDSVKSDSIIAVSNESTSKVSEKVSAGYTCDACMNIIAKLVKTSEFETNFQKTINEKYSILINEATKKKVIIQIVLEGSENVPMGWLELDIINETLSDVTNDPNTPVRLKFNEVLLSEFKKNCLQCCLD